MTRPEPAGVGTAEEIAQIVFDARHVMAGPYWVHSDADIEARIASAITASRRQAKEEENERCAQIVFASKDIGGLARVTIGNRIRAALSPLGERTNTRDGNE